MANTTFQARVQHKRDTAANWTSKNPTILDGELIVVETTDSGTRLKVGKQGKRFSELPFLDEQIYNNFLKLNKTEAQVVAGPVTFSSVVTLPEKTGALMSDANAVPKKYVDDQIYVGDSEPMSDDTVLWVDTSAGGGSSTDEYLPLSGGGKVTTDENDQFLIVAGTSSSSVDMGLTLISTTYGSIYLGFGDISTDFSGLSIKRISNGTTITLGNTGATNAISLHGAVSGSYGSKSALYVSTPICVGSNSYSIFSSDNVSVFSTDLRLKNSSSYGMTLYFGDSNYCYLKEATDDALTIHAKSVIFDCTSASNAGVVFGASNFGTSLPTSGNTTGRIFFKKLS